MNNDRDWQNVMTDFAADVAAIQLAGGLDKDTAEQVLDAHLEEEADEDYEREIDCNDGDDEQVFTSIGWGVDESYGGGDNERY